jgi:hypothetical protein
MRVEIRNRDKQPIATVALKDDGVAEVQPAGALDGINVIAPGPRLVRPEDGEEYLRTLPFAFRSPYLYAVLVA